jgi:hypothetical protein
LSLKENTNYSNASRQWKLINFRLAVRRLSVESTGREFDEGASEIAIVGGTGQYAGITGQMESVNNGDGTFKQTLHYWIR